jgi:membrane-bound ClpP family serine protease
VVVEILVFAVVAVLLFELVEHVVIPLAAVIGARTRRAATGAEGMVGKTGKVLSWSGSEGRVLVDGEIWKAASRDLPAVGGEVVVRAVHGLSLEVDGVPAEHRR